MDEQNAPFDRRLRRLRCDRAAARFAQADYLHRLIADEMIERLDLVRRGFARALDLGSGGPYLADRLRARGIEVIAADAGALFARAREGGPCDEDHLPFGDCGFDP